MGDGLVGLLYTVQYSFGINFNVGFLYLASIYFMFPKHQFLICKSKNNACCEEKWGTSPPLPMLRACILSKNVYTYYTYILNIRHFHLKHWMYILLYVKWVFKKSLNLINGGSTYVHVRMLFGKNTADFLFWKVKICSFKFTYITHIW